MVSDKENVLDTSIDAYLHESQDECHNMRLQLSEDFKACRTIFVALGDETRQGIYIALLESRNLGMRVGTITEKTNLSRPAVSHHLRILKEAGLIDMHREGTKNYYYLNLSEATIGTVGTLFGRIQLMVQKISGERGGVFCTM